jgi:putative ABC transport system permease protein
VRDSSIQPRTSDSGQPPAPPPSPVTQPAQQSPLGSMLQQLRVRGPRSPMSMLGANFSSALEAVSSHRTRSLLTTLGIFIGVAAVIGVLTLTQGAGAYLTNLVGGLGANTIIIVPGSLNDRGAVTKQSAQSLTLQDVESLRSASHVSAISPVIPSGAQVVFGNQNWKTRIQGVSADFQGIGSWDLAQGLWFTNTDDAGGKAVAVLGDTVAHNLFDASHTNPIGQTIRAGNQPFRVVGVLAAKGGFGQDDVIFVPFNTARFRLNNTTSVAEIEVAVDSTDNVDLAQQAIILILERNHHIAKGTPDDFSTITSAQLLQQVQQATQAFSLLLVGIAAISLTVGGIGIMNIMLVSVTERTREIGIRMSIGARRGDVRNQFLFEAVVLCLLGGSLGLLAGLLVGLGITNAFGFPFVVTVSTFVMPLAVSVTIGIVFGLYPALRAARLDPIVALRRAK